MNDEQESMAFEAWAQSTMSKWTWMMDWCKSKGLPPANTHVWNMAEVAWESRSQIEGEQMNIGTKVTTHDKLELPQMPDLPALSPEVFDREERVVSVSLVEILMQNYARTAIEAALQQSEQTISQDREDALRYRWLCDKFGITKLPCAIERIIAGDVYVADGKAGIDEAIDHARRIEEES